MTDLYSQIDAKIYLMDGTTIERSYETKLTNTAGDNTEGKCERFVIPAGTAGFTISLGNMASVDHLALVFSIAVDSVYLSTVAGGEVLSTGTLFVEASGLSSETTIGVDARSTVTDVVVDMFVISNE